MGKIGMFPEQWIHPCGNQCTEKYSALTQIPCNLSLSMFRSLIQSMRKSGKRFVFMFISSLLAVIFLPVFYKGEYSARRDAERMEILAKNAYQLVRRFALRIQCLRTRVGVLSLTVHPELLFILRNVFRPVHLDAFSSLKLTRKKLSRFVQPGLPTHLQKIGNHLFSNVSWTSHVNHWTIYHPFLHRCHYSNWYNTDEIVSKPR